MTRDDIIKLMQQACGPNTTPAWHNRFWTITQKELERFAAFVAEAEREACARVCDDIDAEYKGEDVGATWCSAAIRARGNTTDEQV
jgi:hypothetical protein